MGNFCALPSTTNSPSDPSLVTSSGSSSDPYFDENIQAIDDIAIVGFKQHDERVSTPSLCENMMRNVVNRDIYDIYEPLKILGTGSMGSVTMVRKRKEVIGGSARFHNLSLPKQLELKGMNPCFVKIFTLPVIGNWLLVSSGMGARRIDVSQHSLDGSQKDLDVSNISVPAFILTQGLQRKPRHVSIDSYLNKQRAKGKSDNHYALKAIHLSRINDPIYVEEMKNEIEIMKRLDHCHIVRPLETYEYHNQIYMVMELCSGGDLYTRDPYTEKQAMRIVESLLSALAYMHDHNVMHRDLKYENIMFANIKPTSEIKIIDFGLSKKFVVDQSLNDGVGTMYTMAPEVMKKDYTYKADIWSIGVIAYMLLSSQMPFYGLKRREIANKIIKCTYDFKGRRWTSISSQAKDFVRDLLRRDPQERPTAEEARRALWFNSNHVSSFSSTRTEDGMAAVCRSLESYSTHRKLQKLALMVIAHNSTSEEIGFLRKAFRKYDSKQHGTIELHEFTQCLSIYEYSDDFIENLFQQVDLDGTGEIKYTEFLAATIESAGLVTEERLAEAFDRLDHNDSGFITVQSLRAILGNDVSSDYVEAIIAEAGFNEDKRMSYDEFLSLWGEEIEERKLEKLRKISRRKTVSNLAEEMEFISGED